MKLTIDRIEGDFAVVELLNGQTEKIPTVLLPEGATDGDLLEIRLLSEESEAQKKRIKALVDEVFE